MIELLEFIFRSGWTFFGFSGLFLLFIVLIEAVFNGIGRVVLSIRTKYTKYKNDNSIENSSDNV